MNKVRLILAGLAVLVPLYAVLVGSYAASPQATAVGYAPVQPIPYSHALHVGKLGMDCRYCHSTVEVAAHAAVPPTQTCLNCHSQQAGIRVKTANGDPNPNLQLLQTAAYGSESEKAGKPIPWVRVHDLPGFVYFNHAAHVNRGVGCVSCHGRIDTMEVVYQAQPLSMAWCLECHRDPAPNLRPPEAITDMTWAPPPGVDRAAYGQQLMKRYEIRGAAELTSCSVCHR